jgi:hypothetical protein
VNGEKGSFHGKSPGGKEGWLGETAKFDFFQAMWSLVEVAASDATPEAKRAQLAAALSPLKRSLRG